MVNWKRSPAQAQSAAAAIGVPDDPIRLPAGHLACLMCGVAVRDTDQARVAGLVAVEALGREGQPPPPPGSPRVTTSQTEFLRCPDCLARLDAASALLDAHPHVLDRIGGRSVALHRVECALGALAVLGHDPGRVELPERVLVILLSRLSATGAMARWLARFAPVTARDAAPATANPYPWAHVRHVLRLRLREGYAAVLGERVAATAPPVRLPPPPLVAEAGTVRVEGGCLLCGVAVVTMPAAAAVRLGGRSAAAWTVWTELTVLRGADRLTGHLCPDCERARESVGAEGPTARERAYLAHLVASHREDDADRLRALIVDDAAPALPGYGALVHAALQAHDPVPGPSEQPWGHLRLRL